MRGAVRVRRGRNRDAFRAFRRTVLRTMAALLVLVLLLPLLLSCGGNGDGERREIVCTIYPIYDFVRSVVGDRAADYPIRFLADDGNDPHNFQPSVSELAAISDAAVVFSVGGSSDAWLSSAADSDAVMVPLLDAVAVCGEDHVHEDGHAHDEHEAYDEHFWLSLTNARSAVAEILRVLTEVFARDADAVAVFRENAEQYTAALTALDERYGEVLGARTFDTLLVADRFPFLYLVKDYGLDYAAALPGCSSESDASFSAVVSLVETLREKGLPALLVTETGKRDLAETVMREAGRADTEILVLHSCQSVTWEEIRDGVTYLSIMEANLSVLRFALGA